MTETLPLFPLGTVLYPGLLLPLHIFEERYRQLVRDLLETPEPRRFGVIAIREGRETGVDGVSALHEVGCTATVRRVLKRQDGRFDLVTIGADRFRLTSLDHSRPYLQGEVELLPEDIGDRAVADRAVEAVQRAFRTYHDALSYLVAASVIADLSDRQALLAVPDALRRLVAERALLSRETAMLRTLTSTPAPDLRNTPYNPN